MYGLMSVFTTLLPVETLSASEKVYASEPVLSFIDVVSIVAPKLVVLIFSAAA